MAANGTAITPVVVLTARTEVTDQVLVFGQRHPRTVPAWYETRNDGWAWLRLLFSGQEVSHRATARSWDT